MFMATSAHTVDVGALLAGSRRTLQIEDCVPIEAFEGWSFPEPARVALEVRGVDRCLEIVGTIDVEARGDCDRCLEGVHEPMHLAVEERLESRSAFQDDPFGESNVLSGDRLDVADLTRQLVFSAAPFTVLCDERCEGLCDRCGQNKLSGACDCAGSTE